MSTSCPTHGVKDSEYINWLRVGLALSCMKKSIHSFIEDEVKSMHRTLVHNIYNGPTVSQPKCTQCTANDIKLNRHKHVWVLNQCPALCHVWLAELLRLQNNPSSDKIYWSNCDVASWPTVPWEVAKAYMPKGQKPTNKSPEDCDSQALLTLLANCKHFHGKLSPQGLGQTHKVSLVRNGTMHAPNIKLTDAEMKTYIQDIIAFLEDPVHLLSLKECNEAVLEIKEIRDATMDVMLNLELEIKALRELRGDAIEKLEQDMDRVHQVLDSHKSDLEQFKQVFESVEHVKNATTKNMITLNEIQHHLLENAAGRCAVRTDKVIEPQEVTGLESIQGLSLEDLENTDKSNQQCMNERKNDEASSADSTNIRNENQNEADNKAASKDALDCDMTRENEIRIAEGQDGVICLTKQYSYIKSNLTKRNVDAIAKCLLEKGLLSVDEHETITVTNLPRRLHVDHLLKKVILRGSDQLKAFIKALKIVNIKIAKTLAATEVTDQDRSRFQQVEERALRNVNASARLDSKCNLDDNDIRFFQVYLSAFPEDVESINDTMLTLFHFSIHDHSNVLECRKLDKKIKKLCETMKLCNMNVENELKSLLDDSLYIKWIELRKNRGMHDRSWYLRWLRWLNARVALARFFLRPFGIFFNQAETGSIILKFSAGDDFDMASLTPQLVRENMTDLLWKGYLETQFKITNPVHVTVFIMSPSGNGHDEIHFYLDFDAPDITTRREDYKQDIVAQERKFLSEELDPTELSEWITNQPDAEKTTEQMFEDKCSRSDMSRKEEMDILLDIIYAFKNGQELMKRFCAENDSYVYNKLFLKTDQHSTEEHESLKQKPLQYESGGGLQRLYSFWMNINTEQEDKRILDKIKEFERTTLGEGPSKSLQNLEVLYLKQLQELEFLRTTLDEGPSKPLQNVEVLSSGISREYGLQHDLEYERQKSDDEILEPTVMKYGSMTVVIQVGKLEEIWSDAMIIIRENQSQQHIYHLPRTIIEMVGPQIQREFEAKYPDGLSHNKIAVLSGFNLPVWKILYSESSVGDSKQRFDTLQICLEQAHKLMMQSILFLVQEEYLQTDLRELLRKLLIHSTNLWCGTSTIYFHIDQDNIKWRTMRKIAEDELLKEWSPLHVYKVHKQSDATHQSANLAPKEFNVGDTNVIIQVGKLEGIQSDALVIFEVSKGQWPKQDLPSEILEKAGPMIQSEFEKKFPAGLEYAEVAVLEGHNLPFRKILYGVLPQWRVAWLTQVIQKFVTECLQLAREEKIKSIAFMIPSLAYHVAGTFAHVLYFSVHMPVNDKRFLSISTLNIVIKDGCAGGSTLRKVFEEEWARRIEFKEGHMTVVIQDRLLEEIWMKRREEPQTEAILSKESQEKAKISDSEALIIFSQSRDIAAILEMIAPSLKKEFVNKYSSYLQNGEVAVLDGYNNPFRKIYCSNYMPGYMIYAA